MKNKRLSVLLSFVLVLVLTVSFYVPVHASGNSISFDYETDTTLVDMNVKRLSNNYGTLNFSNLISDIPFNVDSLYEVTINLSASITSSMSLNWYNTQFMLGTNYCLYSYANRSGSNFNVSSNRKYILKGSDLVSDFTLYFYTTVSKTSDDVLDISVSASPTVSVTSCRVLSDAEASDYENGYNAGYSDGVIDGEESVDTDAIYNEAFKAGYDAGFLDGSDDSLVDDKVFLKNYKGSFDMHGIVQIAEHRDYADPDDLFFGSGYASKSVNLFNQYTFDIGKDYLIDFKNLYVVNSSPSFDIYDGEVIYSSVSILPSYSLSGAGIYMSDLGELIYSPTQTGNTNLSATVRGDMTMYGEWSKGVNNDYVNIPEYSFALGSMDWTSKVYYDIDVYEVNIVEDIDYLRDQSNKLGVLNEKTDATIDSIDNLTDTTNQQTESLNQATQNQTDTLTGGFDSSSMSSSNTALSGSIAEFTGAESQITDQSFGFIDQVQFYDLNMQPQLLACITFCSSWLQSLFVNIGDWGILVMVSLSLGFGLMLIGWFKYRRK